MRDEAFQRAAEELLEGAVDEGATPSERRRLRASRDAVIVRLAFSPAGTDTNELVVEPAGSSTPASDAERPAERPELAAIYRRISRRRELVLPSRECVTRLRPRDGGCRCLSEALDDAPDDATKSQIRSAARTRHKMFAAERKRRDREARERLAEAARAAQVVRQPRNVPAATQTGTGERVAASPAPSEPRFERVDGEVFEVLPDGRRRRYLPPKRVRRWYDESEGAGSILNRRF